MQRELFQDRWRRIHGRGFVHRCRVRDIRAGGVGGELVSLLNRRERRDVTGHGLAGLDACRSVELFLVRSPLVRLIVLPAPRVAALATMVLSAAKGAAEISTTRIAWMREEANPAVAAADCAVLQIRNSPQGRIQRQLILTNKRTSAVVLMPILPK
jgi:hypothetical protein